MIWIDRLALVWAAVVLFGLFALEGSALGADNILRAILILILPPWLLLRGLRWVVVGGRDQIP